MKLTLLLTTATASALALTPALASDYPNRPIELIVPAPAGGGTDNVARMLNQYLEAELGQPVAVLNVAGGGGAIGVNQFSRARSDGYTLLSTWNSPITTVPHMQRVQYSYETLTPITSTSQSAYTLCVSPDFPAESGEEFLAELQANPGRYTYGNDGVGGTMRLAAERIFEAFDITARPIPFGGAGETLQNFLGGHVDIYGGSITPVLPYVEEGQAKCLLVTSADDNEALPQASGLAALGHPELETVLWRMMLGPEGMAEERAEAVADAVARAVEHPEFQAFLAAQGETLNLVRGEELRERLRQETQAIGETLENLGLKQQ
ncbi:tripartite tricarboxylate transporter substrate binding protein [Halomonas sp. MCCC 1A11062]|uniref:Bug family tripartite tricarboxylate transporter substrate binding protein n=1 Tax=Halomonas sp. MCCC 1A11062 TaxID=2733485 RepID=UPI001F2C7AB3|nr:tripartite tricarboxylate transporter substrate binding protein [Halomonas sp. MCCC 1A11062]MCE8038472.1 tripartite tricarboxylate transporter substrate binding protein [Halomonas sp. MCCC 1A11062]